MMSRSEVFRIATVNASRVLNKYNLLKAQEPIDIFRIIENEDVVLNFQPLDELAGAYIPANEKVKSIPGIIINEKLPITRQRYTAAHELSHFLREDEASIDTESELFVQTYKREDKELIAEEFASCVLMPRNLIHSNLFRMGISDLQKHQFTSDEIYSLALRMGTSYTATVGRMLTLRLITLEKYEKLRKIKPKRIKETIGADGLASSWNDVWELSELDNSTTIYPNPGDVIRVYLNENPTTGYLWKPQSSTDTISLFDESWESENQLIGGAGWHIFDYTVDRVGYCQLQLDYYRPWLPGAILKSFQINVGAQQKRHGICEDILIA